MRVWFLGREQLLMETLIHIFEQSKHDPFFWISYVMVVAMMCYIVYNLWYTKK